MTSEIYVLRWQHQNEFESGIIRAFDDKKKCDDLYGILIEFGDPAKTYEWNAVIFEEG